MKIEKNDFIFTEQNVTINIQTTIICIMPYDFEFISINL